MAFTRIVASLIDHIKIFPSPCLLYIVMQVFGIFVPLKEDSGIINILYTYVSLPGCDECAEGIKNC